MKFEEIFNNTGWYTADTFADGVFIEIVSGNHGNEMQLYCFSNPNEITPTKLEFVITKSWFNKTFKKVLNRNQLFGESRVKLFGHYVNSTPTWRTHK